MYYSAPIHPNIFSSAFTVIAVNSKDILETQDWAAGLGLKMPTSNYKKFELKLQIM